MKTATEPYQCLWTNTLIFDGENLKQIFINPFGKSQNNNMDVDL